MLSSRTAWQVLVISTGELPLTPVVNVCGGQVATPDGKKLLPGRRPLCNYRTFDRDVAIGNNGTLDGKGYGAGVTYQP